MVKQNVPGGRFSASCIASILKTCFCVTWLYSMRLDMTMIVNECIEYRETLFLFLPNIREYSLFTSDVKSNNLYWGSWLNIPSYRPYVSQYPPPQGGVYGESIWGYGWWIWGLIVYDLKSVGALEKKFVSPIPEQIATTTMHFLKAKYYIHVPQGNALLGSQFVLGATNLKFCALRS